MLKDLLKEDIDLKYEKAFKQLGETNPIFPHFAKKQMGDLVEQIAKSNKIYEQSSQIVEKFKLDPKKYNQTLASQGGFVAEEFHAQTHNMDAILKNDDTRVYTDNYDEWYQNGYKKNGTPDLIAIKEGEVIHESQLKYYKSGDDTAKAMREIDRNGNIKYKDMDSLIGPSDQMDDITKSARRTELKESTPDGRAKVKEASQMVKEKVTDTIDTGESKSTGLTKKESEQLAKDHKKLDKKTEIENKYQTQSTINQMKTAAIGAASMAAITTGVFNTVRYCQMAKEGKITQEEAVYKIISETASASTDSAVKASATVGTHSLIVRYGSKELVSKMTEQSLKGMMRSNIVTVGVISSIEAIKDLVKLSTGSITKEQFYERQGKGILNTSSGVVGGSLGFSVATSIGTSLGYASGTAMMTTLGVVGGISGGLIAGLAMQIAIENHIENAYKDMVRNTNNLKNSLEILNQVSANIFQGQILFSAYLEKEKELNQNFEKRIKSIDKSGNNMKNAIDLI